MIPEVLEVSQSILPVYLKEEVLLEGFHKETRPPTFDGESEASQEANSCILGMNKYFGIHDYPRNEKDIIFIYNLNE